MPQNKIQDFDNWNDHWTKFANSAKDNPAQKYRFNSIIKIIKLKYSPNDAFTILDLGSGQGDFLFKVSREFPKAQLMGFEFSNKGVEITRKKIPEALVFETNLLDISQSLHKYDEWASIITCSEVIEHLDDPLNALLNALPFLKSNGSIIVTVPGGPMSRYDRHIGHRKHYSLRDLLNLFTAAGFSSPLINRAGFPFFNIYKLVIIARGDKIKEDVEEGTKSPLKGLAYILMVFFDFLFKFNLSNFPLGWQIIGIAGKNE